MTDSCSAPSYSGLSRKVSLILISIFVLWGFSTKMLFQINTHWVPYFTHAELCVRKPTCICDIYTFRYRPRRRRSLSLSIRPSMMLRWRSERQWARKERSGSGNSLGSITLTRYNYDCSYTGVSSQVIINTTLDCDIIFHSLYLPTHVFCRWPVLRTCTVHHFSSLSRSTKSRSWTSWWRTSSPRIITPWPLAPRRRLRT